MSEDFELARRLGYQQAIDEIQEWLIRCVRGMSLYSRVELAADLADGSWKAAPRLKGLRERDILLRQAEELHRRRIPLDQMPEAVQAFVQGERTRRQRDRENHQSEVARILRDRYGMEPPTPSRPDDTDPPTIRRRGPA